MYLETIGEPSTLQVAIGSRVYNGLHTGGVQYMQFTGLKDKNGKEIHEADVTDWNSGKGQSCVVWLDDAGCWGTSQDNPLGAAVKMSEIVANIYENSDLLKREAA